MKNTENAFSSFKQFGYLLLHIGGNGDSVQVFVFFQCTWGIKLLNTSKINQRFCFEFQVTFYIYLDDDDDDDDDEDYYE